jgi:hypothetical protein
VISLKDLTVETVCPGLKHESKSEEAHEPKAEEAPNQHCRFQITRQQVH